MNIKRWPTKILSGVVDFQNGLWKGKNEPFEVVRVLRNTNFRNNDGTLNFDDVAEIEVEKKQLETRYIKSGDIILERSGGGPDQPVGRVVYFDGEDDKYSFSNFTTRIRVTSKSVDSKYILLYLYHFYQLGKTEAMQKKTTGIRNLTFSEYKQIEIPLPPLEIQKKVVKKIEEIFAKIAQAQSLRDSSAMDANNLIPSTLDQFFKKGTDWKQYTIGELAGDLQAGFACGKNNEIASGVVHLRTHNIDLDGELNMDKVIKIPKNLVNNMAYGLKKGDILFNNTNSTELVGKTIIIREDLPYAFSNHLNRIRLNASIVIPEWILFVFQKYWRDKYFESICTRWVGQSGINQGKLVTIKIPLPPIAEQKKIVTQLDALTQKVRQLQKLQSETAANLTALKQSILHKAFQGEL